MRILQVIASLDPRGGGPQEGVRQLARAGRELGVETTVASLDAPGQSFLRDEAFEAVALGPAVGSYAYAPRAVSWLRAEARSFDAVIVNGLWQYGSRAVWRALQGQEVPYFVFPHGMLDPYFRHAYPLKHLKKWLYWPWAEYRVLRDARAVFFTCEEERRLARESFWLYRCREEVVGFGTTVPPVGRDSAIAALHAAFPAARNARKLLFLGRLHEKKGCDLLIEAFAGLAAADANWRLVMAGTGEGAYVAGLQALARRRGVADRIIWTGLLSGEVKWGALYAAEAFALPSHQENFGVAVAEALACGVPVLISDKVNIWREIESDGAGLVGPDTRAGTEDLLLRWQHLPSGEAEVMRRCATECFARRFEVGQAARRLVETIDRLRRQADGRRFATAAARAGTG